MKFRQMLACQRVKREMISDLSSLYDEMISLERAYIDRLAKENAEPFREAARKLFRFDTERCWGYSSYQVNDTANIDIDDNSVTLTMERDDYCRGCYMGVISDSIVFPRAVIDDENELPAFVVDRSKRVHHHIETMEVERQAEIARKDAEKAERDKAELERLLAIYGDRT